MEGRKHELETAYGNAWAAAPGRPEGRAAADASQPRTGAIFAGFVALGIAVVLYRLWPDAAFALVCAVSTAAGWLLSRRAVQLICVAEAGALAVSVWPGALPWATAMIQLAVAVSLAALAHLAAERDLSSRANRENERRLGAATFLLETAEFLASTTDQDVILNTAVRAAASGISRPAASGAPHAAFHEVDGEQVRIVLVADDPRNRVLATGFEYQLARNQAARAAVRTGRPAIVRPDHLNGNLRSLADDLGWQALIMAPVYCGGSLRGLLAASANDTPEVDQLQQFMLGRLARFTSAGLDSAAARQPSLPATHTAATDGAVVDGLLSELAAKAAADTAVSLLSREVGLAALEHDVLESRRVQARSHCLALLRVPRSQEPGGGGELIRLVADRLRSYLRRDDLIFKYADDEIVCSFADTDAGDVQTILNRVQSELAREIGFVPFAIGLTSVGAAQTAS